MVRWLWSRLIPAARSSPRSRQHARDALLVWEFAGIECAAAFLADTVEARGTRYVKAVERDLVKIVEAEGARRGSE